MSKSSKPKRAQRKRTKRPRQTDQFGLFDGKRISDVIPKNLGVTLRYTDPTLIRMAGALPWSAYYMRVNDVWDPDPALGSAAVSGMQEWCNFFQKWRVHKVRIQLDVVNINTNPVTVFIYSGLDGSLPGSFAAAVNYSELPGASRVLTLTPAGTGQSKGRLDINYDVGQMYGSVAEFMSDENLVGNGGVSPSSPGTKLNFQIIAFSNGNISNGLYTRLRVQYAIKFFDRLPVLG